MRKKKQVQTEAKKKMENNLYSRYQSYVATFQLQFGTGIRPPTYEEYIQLYLNQQCSQPANESSEVILGEKEKHNQQQQPGSSKIKRERWSEVQAQTLVSNWKNYFSLVESHKANSAWNKIQAEVNKVGPFKSLKQCKDKLRNLKDAYKVACDNNKQSGAQPKFPAFYDIFDEIYGTRDVINMPNLLDSGKRNENVISQGEGTVQQNENVISQGEGPVQQNDNVPEVDKNVIGTPKQLKKSKKPKQKKKCLREELVELQKEQLAAFREQTANSEAVMQKMFEKQLEHEERERNKDREFLLQLGQILKK